MLVASNRGPVTFSINDRGALVARRGSGGIVSGMQEVLREAAVEPDGGGIVWVCAALGDADRRAARAHPEGRLDLAGFDTGGAAIRMLDVDREVFDRAYNAIANRTLWFVLHLLFAPANEPTFGESFWRDWAAYEAYNETFAEALAAEAAPGAAVLIQDYHLTLVPGMLRALRPDLRISHFTHTPWAPPEYFRMLPDRVSRAVLAGMLGADRLGFLTARWAGAFRDCARAFLGAEAQPAPGGPVDEEILEHDGRRVWLGVHPLGVDATALRTRAAAPDVRARAAELRALVGDQRLIVRIDRTELTKNIVRGLEAYRGLLRAYPDWRGRVTHLVCAYPSRQDMPEYREYTAAVRRVAAEIDAEFGTDSWRPLRLEVTDDYPRSLAALTLADVLVVNPIRDGMNLVAKEGPTVCDRGLALVLSREAGACAELGAINT
ncbi:MAG: trehalose-6-phosphate synthase [Frankia sp.]|nr:trehalose-6-phosphate synthase [Frankia sp.]